MREKIRCQELVSKVRKGNLFNPSRRKMKEGLPQISMEHQAISLTIVIIVKLVSQSFCVLIFILSPLHIKDMSYLDH